MTPEQGVDLTILEEQIQPSKTYYFDFAKKRISSSMADGHEAIVQAIKKIIQTERYAYVIYSSQYGIELERLVGKDYDFIISEIKRTAEEAFCVDDRIFNISDFQMEKVGFNEMLVSFIVHSIEGDVNANMEVIIA